MNIDTLKEAHALFLNKNLTGIEIKELPTKTQYIVK